MDLAEWHTYLLHKKEAKGARKFSFFLNYTDQASTPPLLPHPYCHTSPTRQAPHRHTPPTRRALHPLLLRVSLSLFTLGMTQRVLNRLLANSWNRNQLVNLHRSLVDHKPLEASHPHHHQQLQWQMPSLDPIDRPRLLLLTTVCFPARFHLVASCMHLL